MNALEKIEQLEQKHQEQIALLKGEAITELSKQLAEAKAVVAKLTAQYEGLTGKKLSGEKAEGEKVPRKRLSAEEKAALVLTVEGIVKGAKGGISFGDIAQQTGASDSAVRDALKTAKVKTTGVRRTTRYFSK